MYIENDEPVASVGEVGVIAPRSYGRVYLTQRDVTPNYSALVSAWVEVQNQKGVPAEKQLDRPRRFVLRSIITQKVLSAILNNGLPGNPAIDALLPMDQVDGHESEYLIILGQNQHDNHLSKYESARLRALTDAHFLQSGEGNSSLIETIQTLPEGFTLTTSFTDQDYPDLLDLWRENFEWGTAGLDIFAQELAQGTQWFSGVRDQNGKLVAASMAEGIVFASRRYIELTEWAANTRGVASKMVIGLISQVLEAVYYGALTGQQRAQNMPILPAEMNLYHPQPNNLGSPGAGISAGLRLPNINGNKHTSASYNTLRHNVLVGSGRLNYPEAHSGTAPAENYNNFAYGILPHAMLETMYSERNVQALLEYIELHDQVNS